MHWISASGLIVLVLQLSACASPGPPRAYFDEDVYARYYATKQDHVLRVERDGSVLDVTCMPPAMVKGHDPKSVATALCADGRIERMGHAARGAEGWDMSAYGIAPETGTCRSLFAPFRREWFEGKRHSCWNRLWEVPAAVIVYPAIVGVAVGVVTAPVWVPLILL